MKFLSESDTQLLKAVEQGLKNKFRWCWLTEKDDNDEELGTWCKKIDVAGECFCVPCGKTFRYHSEGLRALMSHARSQHHRSVRDSAKSTVKLCSYGAPNDEKNMPLDMNSRKVRAEAIICSFIAENSLPHTMGPKLLQLSQVLSRDAPALQHAAVGRNAVSYKTNYGLAKTVKDRIIQSLQHTCFSVNIDESTSNGGKNILTVLVRYFCIEQKKVVVQHLVSFETKSKTAKSIYSTVVGFFEENSIPWNNFMSILMDSCNTMRGKHSGVETLLRQHKVQHLLDISGDLCHMANNSAKRFTKPFQGVLETLCDDVHFDLESAERKYFFLEMCDMLGQKKLLPLSRPEHRWLYVLDALERLCILWDVVLIFYFSWVTPDDQTYYECDVEGVYKKYNVTADNMKKIKLAQKKIGSKKITLEGRKRKERIIQKIFTTQKRTLLYISVYRAVLLRFQQFIKMFQKQQPMIHELHVQLFSLLKNFLAYFIKHELIHDVNNYKQLLKLDVQSESNHLPKKLMFVGPEGSKLITQSRPNDHVVNQFRETLKEAYICCALYMMQTLPLDNTVLISLSGLNPSLRGKTATFTALLKLADMATNVLSDDEKFQLDLEIRHYQVDENITDDMVSSHCVDAKSGDSVKLYKPIDEFWAEVFEISRAGQKAYPCLSKLVKALLSCFHGPVVEGAFNLMDGIITSTRTSLSIESFDSAQTVKYYLMSKGYSTFDLLSVDNPITNPVDKDLMINMLNSYQMYQKMLQPEAGGSSHKVSDSNEVSVDARHGELVKSSNREQSSSASTSQLHEAVHIPEHQKIHKRNLTSDAVAMPAQPLKRQSTLSSFFKRQ